MRIILLPVADRPECAFALEAAFRLAAVHHASVLGCHVRPHRTGGSELTRSARSLFRRSATTAGFRLAKRPAIGRSSLALWQEQVGTPDRIMAICGPTSDLSVLSRPKPKGSGAAKNFLLATLFNSARPVLLLPQRRIASLSTRILIAWNRGREAALAVSAAMPLLQKAGQVTIVACGAEDSPGPKAARLRDYLTHWGISARTLHTRGRDVDGEIAGAYRDTGANLLVMGAYSHPRVHERIFGGVTQTMLFRSTLPVLMFHP